MIVEKCDCGRGRNWHALCYYQFHIPPLFRQSTNIHGGMCVDTWQEAIDYASKHVEAYNPFPEVKRVHPRRGAVDHGVIQAGPGGAGLS